MTGEFDKCLYSSFSTMLLAYSHVSITIESIRKIFVYHKFSAFKLSRIDCNKEINTYCDVMLQYDLC